MREKSITAICHYDDGIEWTTIQLGEEHKITQDNLPLESPKNEANKIAIRLTPDGLREKIRGDLIVALRSSEMLMHVMELPTIDPDELREMIAFQIDKIAPFPINQLATSHEILQTNEESSTILMATAKHDCIDKIGEAFLSKKIHIHSIDARVLGWLHLMKTENIIGVNESEILIIDDTIDFNLIILKKGTPLLFRVLHHIETPLEQAKEIAKEVEYGLTTLETSHELHEPSIIQYWCNGDNFSPEMLTELASLVDIQVEYNNLLQLPPLSTGIAQRAITQHEKRIELIPREWIEYIARKKLNKQAIKATACIVFAWILLNIALVTAYKIRKGQFLNIKNQAAETAPMAQQALNNREKLIRLKNYTDRSASALEGLREVTQKLPAADIEFSSYKFTKGKAAMLSGNAANDDLVTQYFNQLTQSDLFTELENERYSTQNRRGKKRTLFSVTLILPSEAEEKE